MIRVVNATSYELRSDAVGVRMEKTKILLFFFVFFFKVGSWWWDWTALRICCAHYLALSLASPLVALEQEVQCCRDLNAATSMSLPHASQIFLTPVARLATHLA
jgi:hypothetical protein